MTLSIAKGIVDWAALGQVALISLLIGVVVTTALAVAVRSFLVGADASQSGDGAGAIRRQVTGVLAVAIAVGVLSLGIYEIAVA